MWRSAFRIVARRRIPFGAVLRSCLPGAHLSFQAAECVSSALHGCYTSHYSASPGYRAPDLTRSLRTSVYYRCKHQADLVCSTVLRLRNMGKLDVQSPVPSDIAIAQAVAPIHIAEVAKAIGLSPNEYDLYGTTKAKASRASSFQRQQSKSCMHQNNPSNADPSLISSCRSSLAYSRSTQVEVMDTTVSKHYMGGHQTPYNFPAACIK